MTRSYGTPLAFKAALEARLHERAATQGRSLNRVRQLLVMERFLARVFPAIGSAVLKGGLVMELRLDRARATKDVDLRVSVRADDLLDRLQAAGRMDLGDFLAFEVRADPSHPTIEADGLRYDGQRFRAEARLAGRTYGSAFGVDIAVGEPLVARAIRETFAHRATHPVPLRLADPPEAWAPVYARMAEEEDLPWSDLASLGGAVRGFLDPVLAGVGGVWEPAAWRWGDPET